MALNSHLLHTPLSADDPEAHGVAKPRPARRLSRRALSVVVIATFVAMAGTIVVMQFTRGSRSATSPAEEPAAPASAAYSVGAPVRSTRPQPVIVSPQAGEQSAPSQADAIKVGGPMQWLECSACKFAVGQVEKRLASDGTVAKIVAAADALCLKLPMSFRSECETLADTYLKPAIQRIANGLPAQTVCAEVGMCSHQEVLLGATQGREHNRIASIIAAMRGAVASSECDLCQEGVTAADQLLSDPGTKARIDKAVAFLCGEVMSQFKYGSEDISACTAVADQVVDEIIQKLVSVDALTVCKDVKLCSADAKPVAPPHNANGPPGCGLCESAVRWVDGQADTSGAAFVVKELDSLCKMVPVAGISTACTQFVNSHAKCVVEEVMGEVADPKRSCSMLHLCNGSKSFPPLADTCHLTCDTCTLGVSDVEAQLLSSKNVGAVVAWATHACSYVPSAAQPLCAALVADNIHDIVKFISVDPASACRAARLCPAAAAARSLEIHGLERAATECSTFKSKSACDGAQCSWCVSAAVPSECVSVEDAKQLPSAVFQCDINTAVDARGTFGIDWGHAVRSSKADPVPAKEQQQRLGGAIECFACKEAVQLADGQLKSADNVQKLVNELDSLCAHLPATGNLSGGCEAFVSGHLPCVVGEVVDGLIQPEAVCQLIGKCPTPTPTPSPTKKGGLLRKLAALPRLHDKCGLSCDACTDAVAGLDNQITSPADVAKVVQWADKVCNHVPNVVKDLCLSLIQDDVSDIMGALKADPKAACQKLHMCA